jgi:hypothetical protein
VIVLAPFANREHDLLDAPQQLLSPPGRQPLGSRKVMADLRCKHQREGPEGGPQNSGRCIYDLAEDSPSADPRASWYNPAVPFPLNRTLPEEFFIRQRYGTRNMKSHAMWILGLIVTTLPTALSEVYAEVDSRASAAGNGGLPEYSWDTVPVYIHFGKTGGLTDEEVEFVATHSDFVCLEKGHGAGSQGSTEKGIEQDAVRLKRINPKIKVIYYWNTFLDYPMYQAHEVYEQHPEWWLRTADGSLDKKHGRIKRYDLSNPEVRAWWAGEVRKAVVDGSCDGVFMDAFPQVASRANVRLWGQAKYDAIQQGLVQTILQTREEAGPDCVLVFNGIRNTESLQFGTKYLAWTDAATIEHFDQFQSRDKECVVRDMEAMIAAGRQGKAVIMKGWPDFNWLDLSQNRTGSTSPTYESLLARARAKITFPLACFLIAAQPHAYFCYSWGYREQDGSLSEYPELQRPLGPPKGDAIRDGWVFTRSFEHVDVWVDVSEKTARLTWR